MNDIGRYIRDQRFALNLFQRDIAHAVNCSEATISAIESGEIDSSFSLITSILVVLHNAGAPRFDIYDSPARTTSRKEEWPSREEGEQS
jgi:predicted transcriptional regulator